MNFVFLLGLQTEWDRIEAVFVFAANRVPTWPKPSCSVFWRRHAPYFHRQVKLDGKSGSISVVPVVSLIEYKIFESVDHKNKDGTRMTSNVSRLIEDDESLRWFWSFHIFSTKELAVWATVKRTVSSVGLLLLTMFLGTVWSSLFHLFALESQFEALILTALRNDAAHHEAVDLHRKRFRSR